LESVYHQAPFKKYYDEELRPWYLLCLATRERTRSSEIKSNSSRQTKAKPLSGELIQP
jgi:hypothetical protein